MFQENIICKCHPSNSLIGKRCIQKNQSTMYIQLDNLNMKFHLSNSHQHKFGIEFQMCKFYIYHCNQYKLGYQPNILNHIQYIDFKIRTQHMELHKANINFLGCIFLEHMIYSLFHLWNMFYNQQSNHSNPESHELHYVADEQLLQLVEQIMQLVLFKQEPNWHREQLFEVVEHFRQFRSQGLQIQPSRQYPSIQDEQFEFPPSEQFTQGEVHILHVEMSKQYPAMHV
ncbi:unnamed protein product [Paramecium pentaurelia]|uniref:Uncharacterized protein n=1 Tax=Paramecium pentaurelia TaxID=43138 RepID=A0A8S1X7T2_9CILI|nr:unnamed protein product [Paramecium pentaurelia]